MPRSPRQLTAGSQASANVRAVAGTIPRSESPSVSQPISTFETVSLREACRLAGVNHYQIVRAAGRGEIRTLNLPGVVTSYSREDASRIGQRKADLVGK